MCLHEVWSYHKIRKRKGSITSTWWLRREGTTSSCGGQQQSWLILEHRCANLSPGTQEVPYMYKRDWWEENIWAFAWVGSHWYSETGTLFPLTASVYMLWTATLWRKGMALPEHILWKYVVLRAWKMFSSVRVRRSVVSNSLQPHGLQHARPLNFKPGNICIYLKIQRFLMV